MYELTCASGKYRIPGPIPFVMGILNAAPDSFSDGATPLEMRLEQLLSEGPDMIDLGGESTRPGADNVPVAEEIRRVLPVLRKLRKMAPGILISIDTRKAAVAERCLDEGADIINDVSNLRCDPLLPAVAAKYSAGLILNHSRGTPKDMLSAENTFYPGGVAETVAEELKKSVEKALENGVERSAIILDPGLGFAKNPEQSELLIAHPEPLKASGFPLLSGPSRKGFIGNITGEKNPALRDYGTCGAVIASMLAGYAIVRVHNVKAAKDCLKVFSAIQKTVS